MTERGGLQCSIDDEESIEAGTAADMLPGVLPSIITFAELLLGGESGGYCILKSLLTGEVGRIFGDWPDWASFELDPGWLFGMEEGHISCCCDPAALFPPALLLEYMMAGESAVLAPLEHSAVSSLDISLR